MARIGFAISDVRDVAAMHLAALRKPESIGQHYLCTGPYMTFERVAEAAGIDLQALSMSFRDDCTDEEMARMVSANRIYEANLSAVQAAKEMIKRTLEV